MFYRFQNALIILLSRSGVAVGAFCWKNSLFSRMHFIIALRRHKFLHTTWAPIFLYGGVVTWRCGGLNFYVKIQVLYLLPGGVAAWRFGGLDLYIQIKLTSLLLACPLPISINVCWSLHTILTQNRKILKLANFSRKMFYFFSSTES